MIQTQVTKGGPLLNGRAPAIIASECRSWLQGMGRLYRDKVRDLTPVVTGVTRQSIRFETHARSLSEYELDIYSTREPFLIGIIEFGRKPFAPPVPGSTSEHGTQGAHMFERAFLALRGGQINGHTLALADRLAAGLNR